MLSLFQRRSAIHLHTVLIGKTRVSLPVADLRGTSKGKTLLVTAGMDGDEYASIEAAYSLIEKYRAGAFAGRLIILPIVNIPGFENATPFNPIDGILPYRVFPGKPHGTATEQLMHWVYKNYVSPADVWIDLHGGYMTETLVPFVWTFETEHKEINSFVGSTLDSIESELKIYEHIHSYSKANALAKENKAFFLFEAGDKGRRDQDSMSTHIQWTEAVMGEMGMVDVRKKMENGKWKMDTRVMRKVVYHTVEKNCLWYPKPLKYSFIKGELLGTLKHIDGRVYKEVHAKEAGTLLWRREGMSVKKGDFVVVLGTDIIAKHEINR